MRQTFSAAALAAALVGCGGEGGGGEPRPTAASVSVSAPGTGPLASIGDTRGVTAVVRDANGTAIPDASVSWSAAPAGVLTLSGSSGLAITATAAANGGATLTATSGTATGSATIDVAQRLASVEVTPSPLSLTPGATRQLAANARDARGNGIAGATGFTYSGGDAAVATVSASGLVTAVANGTATVTVALTRDGASASTPVAVTVSPVPLAAAVAATAGSAFDPSTVEIGAGGTVTWTFGAEHNVTFSTVGAPEDIATRSSGSAARTFAAAGTFAYRCTIHTGMNGQVVVR